MTKLAKIIGAVLCAAMSVAAMARAQTSGQTTVGGVSVGAVLPGYSSVAAAPTQRAASLRHKLSQPAGAWRLCFEPGAGWQRIPGSVSDGPGRASGSGVSRRASGSNSKSRAVNKAGWATPSGQAPEAESACPASYTKNLSSATVAGGGTQSISPAAPGGVSTGTLTAPGTYDAAQAAGIKSHAGGMGGGSVNLATGGASSAGTSMLAMQSPGLKKRHLSRLELRSMIWDAPDLETRMKLRKQLQRLKQKSTHSAETRRQESSDEDLRGGMGTEGERRKSDAISGQTSQP